MNANKATRAIAIAIAAMMVAHIVIAAIRGDAGYALLACVALFSQFCIISLTVQIDRGER